MLRYKKTFRFSRIRKLEILIFSYIMYHYGEILGAQHVPIQLKYHNEFFKKLAQRLAALTEIAVAVEDNRSVNSELISRVTIYYSHIRVIRQNIRAPTYLIGEQRQ